MLSRVFNAQILLILFTLLLSLTIGCGAKTVDVATSQDHPANPNAQQGASADHHNMAMEKMHKGHMPMTEMHEGDAGHSSHRTISRWRRGVGGNA